MSWGQILFIVLVVALLVTAPIWPYAKRWGYWPSSVLLVATILVGLKVLGPL